MAFQIDGVEPDTVNVDGTIVAIVQKDGTIIWRKIDFTGAPSSATINTIFLRIEFDTDGTWQIATGGGPPPDEILPDYHRGTPTGLEIRASIGSGSTFNSDVLDTWLALTSKRMWGVEPGVTITLTFEIRQSSSGFVLATDSIQLFG